MRQVIAVTGTPGTGKTTVARVLARHLGAKLVDLNQLIIKKKLYHLDRDGVRVAHLKDVRKEFGDLLKKIQGPVVVEGLLSHLLGKKQISKVVVLRTHPRVLRRRLSRRRYRGRKLEDNLESEALDIILWEAVHIHGMERVLEIDTTGRRPSETAAAVVEALYGKRSLRPGRVDWLEDFYGSRR